MKSIYASPNPVDKTLRVKIEGLAASGVLSLKNLTGNAVRQQAVEKGNGAEIPVESLPTGIYLLEFKGDSAAGLPPRKIIVQH